MNSCWRLVLRCLVALSVESILFCHAAEYEVHGIVRQSITDYNVPKLEYTNEFTVYVRDCGWLIQTTEFNSKGDSWKREVGSPNGAEVYESNGKQAFITGSGIPVELLDKGVNGHLWLMFASQCYWGNLRDDQLTPVFDWHASAGAEPNRKVTAEWELLNGAGSLPREVRYLGRWDETNGLYRITGTNLVGGVLVPSGFVFEERNAFPQRGMVLRKRVEAKVTSVQAVCSRKDMVPVRANAKTAIVDWRLPSSGNRIASYRYAASNKWPTIEEARKIAPSLADGNPNVTKPKSRSRSIVLGLLCTIVFLGPLLMVYIGTKSRKRANNK